MKRLLVQWLIASGVAIAAFWPLASREARGPWFATHVVIPMAIAVVALLVFRILRSLMVAVLCALAAAGVIVLLLRSYGDQVHALFQAILP